MINDIKARAAELYDALKRRKTYGTSASQAEAMHGLIEDAMRAAIEDHTFQLEQAGVEIPASFRKAEQVPAAYENPTLSSTQVRIGRWLHRIDRMMGPGGRGEYDAEALTHAFAVAIVGVVALEFPDRPTRQRVVAEAVSHAMECTEDAERQESMQTDQRYS